MPKQLSDCCKAEIVLTGLSRPTAFACVKCDRFIGTPLPSECPTPTRELEEGREYLKGFEKVVVKEIDKHCQEVGVGWEVVAPGGFVLKICKNIMKKMLKKQDLISRAEQKEADATICEKTKMVEPHLSNTDRGYLWNRSLDEAIQAIKQGNNQ